MPRKNDWSSVTAAGPISPDGPLGTPSHNEGARRRSSLIGDESSFTRRSSSNDDEPGSLFDSHSRPKRKKAR